MHGLAGSLGDLTVVSSQYVMLFCSKTLRYASRVGVTGSRIWSPCLVVPGQDASGLMDGCIRITYEMVTEHFANENLSVVFAKCCFWGL